VSVYSLTEIARCALPLLEGRNGSIVTLSYIGGLRVVKNYNVMGIAKAALEASVRYLAHDLGPRGIRVNAVAPGSVPTEGVKINVDAEKAATRIARTPMRRLATVEDIAAAACWLASPDSAFVTGECIKVDGGATHAFL
jgi:enoyl-[acyl-carrier-protein] reductase (NADH)